MRRWRERVDMMGGGFESNEEGGNGGKDGEAGDFD